MGKRQKLGEILLSSGLVDSKTLLHARDIQKIQPQKKMGHILIGMGVVDDVEIANALASQKRLPFIRLHRKRIPQDILDLLPSDLANKHEILPIKKKENKLFIATYDPLNKSAIDDVSFVTNCRVYCAVCPERDIKEALDKFYPKRDLKKDLHFGKGLTDFEIVQQSSEDDDIEPDDLLNMSELPPVIRFTNAIIAEAIKNKASDLHIEPQKDALVIRNRIDGVLQESLRTEKHIHPSIVSRIKIISDLDIAIRRKPQDGKAQVKYAGKPFDLRVSTIPTSYGEKITIRVLNPDTAQMSPEQLGFGKKDLSNLLTALEMPQGLILVTGPTGSGKSSTLYACLKKLNQPDVNIITIEDPVEFDVKGINQVQINPKAGISFAAGLRSILRQDPDIVMVGEIRDSETARIAFQAAQTGHLVLSTLHTNDAPSAISRLMDLDIENFLISGSLLTVLAQRLVRKICTKCKVETVPSPQLLQKIQPFLKRSESVKFYKGAGCKACNNSGYSGRHGIFEVLMITPNLKGLINPGISSQVIKEAAIKEDFHPMAIDGIQKALSGLTTLEEIFRVATPEDDAKSLEKALDGLTKPETVFDVHSSAKETKPHKNKIRSTKHDKDFINKKSLNSHPTPDQQDTTYENVSFATCELIDEEEPSAFEHEPPAFTCDMPKILVVDDNKIIRNMISGILTASDYVVETASNGIQAFEKTKQKGYSLIITDYKMPEMDGLELIQRIRDNPDTRNTPIIMLTSNDEVDSEVRIIKGGADDYLVKPVNAKRFMARVHRLLRDY